MSGFHHYEQNFLAVMYALQAVLPPLMEAGAGQVVVQTSATGGKPQPTMMAYSAMRAAAGMMCRCAAMTAAPKGVCVNVVGREAEFAKHQHVIARDVDAETQGGNKKQWFAV